MRRRLLSFIVCLFVAFSPLHAAVAVVASASAGSTTAGVTVTTAGINSTAGTLAVVCAASGSETIIAGDISDSNGHTWTARTEYNSGADVGKIRMFYAVLTSTGSGHTFSVAPDSDWTSMAVVVLSGTHASTPYDVENGYTGGSAGSTIQPGSVTPSANNEALVACLGWKNTRTISIDSSFTIQTQKAWATAGVADWGIGLATKIQTTAGAENPTWTLSTFDYQNANIATFKEAAAAGTTRSCCLGVP